MLVAAFRLVSYSYSQTTLHSTNVKPGARGASLGPPGGFRCRGKAARRSSGSETVERWGWAMAMLPRPLDAAMHSHTCACGRSLGLSPHRLKVPMYSGLHGPLKSPDTWCREPKAPILPPAGFPEAQSSRNSLAIPEKLPPAGHDGGNANLRIFLLITQLSIFTSQIYCSPFFK